MKKICFLIVSVMLLASCKNKDNGPVVVNPPSVDFAVAADNCTQSLLDNFWNTTRNYFNSASDATSWNNNYWPQAHALDVMVDAYLRSGNQSYVNYFNNWLTGVRSANGNRWTNSYYDDMEWIGLATLRAYQATKNEDFKKACMDVWNGDATGKNGSLGIKSGWNAQGGGGIAWEYSQQWSKNACSNGPAALLAAHLYQEFGNSDDLDWAKKIYEWQKDHLFNLVDGSVADNLDARSMSVNWSMIFTYNQGTFMGAALELYKITGERSYLNDAGKAADYTISTLINSADQLLKSEGSGDGALFKGIFVRNFAQLIMLDDLNAGTRKRYVNFLKHNGELLWQGGTGKNYGYMIGPYWKTPPGTNSQGKTQTGLNEQLSGCMLLEALAFLQKEKMF